MKFFFDTPQNDYFWRGFNHVLISKRFWEIV